MQTAPSSRASFYDEDAAGAGAVRPAQRPPHFDDDFIAKVEAGNAYSPAFGIPVSHAAAVVRLSGVVEKLADIDRQMANRPQDAEWGQRAAGARAWASKERRFLTAFMRHLRHYEHGLRQRATHAAGFPRIDYPRSLADARLSLHLREADCRRAVGAGIRGAALAALQDDCEMLRSYVVSKIEKAREAGVYEFASDAAPFAVPADRAQADARLRAAQDRYWVLTAEPYRTHLLPEPERRELSALLDEIDRLRFWLAQERRLEVRPAPAVPARQVSVVLADRLGLDPALAARAVALVLSLAAGGEPLRPAA